MKEYLEELNNIKYKIIVGQNEKDNWNIIDDSDDSDLWIHVHNLPSAHVIIKEIFDKNNINSNEMTEEIIKLGCQYVKKQSKYPINKKMEFIYTTIKNVSKDKIVGSVKVSEFKLINC